MAGTFQEMSAMKKNPTNFILVMILLAGVCLILYPIVSNYWNSLHQTRAIASYVDAVDSLDQEEYDRILNEAYEYNKALVQNPGRYTMSDEEREYYNSLLDVSGTGMMGYVEIEKIHCSLPIYHGTDEGILQVAVGHIEGSSLPVGGESTHCVMSGHRGLPSAKLFSDLDQLAEGDTFVIRVMKEVLTYEVDQVRIVLPEEVGNLEIMPGEDLCTLVTCTPYGINSHRLLVRGHRTETDPSNIDLGLTADAVRIEPLFIAPVLAVPILLVLLGLLLIPSRGPARKGGDSVENESENEIKMEMDDSPDKSSDHEPDAGDKY